MRQRNSEGTKFRKAVRARKFTLPSWWMQLSPGRPAKFWVEVERIRRLAGASRHDVSAITHIVHTYEKERQ